MPFFFVVPLWAMAFLIGLILLLFPTQRFAAYCLILISTCATVGALTLSLALMIVSELSCTPDR
jgi:hypothetical protein